MKIKNILLGVLFGLVGFGAVYATLAPNIAGRPTITSANPNNYYTIIQSGTTQGKISMSDFANSISGSLGLSGFLTGFTESDPIYMAASGDYLPLAGNTTGTAMSGDIWMGSSSEMFFGTNYYLYGGPSFIEMYGGNGIDIQSYMGIDSSHKIYLTFQNTTPPFTYGVVLGSGALEYTDNYSSIFTDRSLIDKGYADAMYCPLSMINTGFTYPGSDSYVPTTKAVADYIEAMALNLGDVITTGGFYISGASTARRTIETGSRYRIEYATGLLGPWKTAGMLDNGGTHNTTFGVGAGRDITAGIFNTFIGHEAGKFNTDGNRNTAVGGYAMYSLTNGTDNTCMGIYCMQKLKTGKYNVSIGDESLWSNQTGDNNVAIGMGAGEYAEGSNNTFIGRFADITGDTYLNHSIALGDRALVWTSSMMQIGNTGLNFISTRAKLGIGVQFPTNALSVSGSIDIPATEWMYFGTGRRIGTSGDNLSFQQYTGGNWVERGFFTP